ncbi:hypothetical protein FOL46_000870 [Perkinsus olseni]|uniref:Uncharacterized protein n=1 Tax=Perkinsus olseni TaxID=32597 RepID=A0A7J6MGX9_PEROL|nr:hypothetical protein FOL46_000870 [Perkinsus olseni]
MVTATPEWKSRAITSLRLVLGSIVLIATCRSLKSSSRSEAARSGSLLLRPGRWYAFPTGSSISLEAEVSDEPISSGCAKYFPSYQFTATKPNFTCPFENVVRGQVEENTLCGGFSPADNNSKTYIPPDPDTFCNLEPIPPICLEESFRRVKSQDPASDALSFDDDEYTPFMEYQSDRYRFALHVLDHIGCGLRYWITQGNAISIIRHGAFFGHMPNGKWDLVDSDLDINIILPKAQSTGLTLRHVFNHLQHSGGRISCNGKGFSEKTVHCWVLCPKGQKVYGLTQPWKHLSGGKECLIEEYCAVDADKNCGAVELKLVRDPSLLTDVFPLLRVWSGLPPRQEYPVWVAGNIIRDARARSTLVGSSCLPFHDKPLNGPLNMPALARKHCNRYEKRLGPEKYHARCEQAPRLSTEELSELIAHAERLNKRGMPSFWDALVEMLTTKQFGGCAKQMPSELPDLQKLLG